MNDLSNLQHLIAVDDGANQSKSDQGPELWQPARTAYHCQYAVDWIVIKSTWELTVTATEWGALEDMLDTCPGGSPTTYAGADTGLPIGTRTGEPILFDPDGPDRNCGDFPTWAHAQDFYEAAGGNDAHGLDGNNDGTACEGLPGAP